MDSPGLVLVMIYALSLEFWHTRKTCIIPAFQPLQHRSLCPLTSNKLSELLRSVFLGTFVHRLSCCWVFLSLELWLMFSCSIIELLLNLGIVDESVDIDLVIRALLAFPIAIESVRKWYAHMSGLLGFFEVEPEWFAGVSPNIDPSFPEIISQIKGRRLRSCNWRCLLRDRDYRKYWLDFF